MRYALVVLSLLAQVGADAQTPEIVADRAIAAERASRFDEALVLYREALQLEPQRTDLWVRVADIHARLGRLQECIAALARASSASPKDVAVHVRLSAAYAEAGSPELALAAIEVAAALEPASTEIMRRRAILATWSGAYGRAQDSYRRLLRLDPADVESMLALARVSAWAGDTDVAVEMYRSYLEVRGENRGVWIELARVQSWRGNYAASWDVLGEYRERFGESAEYMSERASVLARGGRPRRATQLLDGLLAMAPDDYGLHLSRTVALAAQQKRRDALSAFETIERLRPEQPETRGAKHLVRVAVASTGQPQASFYSDSDGLSIRRLDPRFSVAVGDGTRLNAGYERADFRARAGSGLDQIGGATTAQHEHAWVGVRQRAGRLTLAGQAGYASVETKDRFAYAVSGEYASDTVQMTAGREAGFFLVSPRTIGLGLTRLTHTVQFDWTPSFRYHVAGGATHDDLSDGNRRWDVLIVPRRSVARTQRLNLDLGVQLRQFGTTRNLENGYYDPSRYENYSLVAFPYWKVSENIGVGGVFAAGVQRDDSRPSFGLGGNAAVEATFGIYRNWMVKVNGSTTVNDRLQSGAFRGYGGQAVLIRRF